MRYSAVWCGKKRAHRGLPTGGWPRGLSSACTHACTCALHRRAVHVHTTHTVYRVGPVVRTLKRTEEEGTRFVLRLFSSPSFLRFSHLFPHSFFFVSLFSFPFCLFFFFLFWAFAKPRCVYSEFAPRRNRVKHLEFNDPRWERNRCNAARWIFARWNSYPRGCCLFNPGYCVATFSSDYVYAARRESCRCHAPRLWKAEPITRH